LDTTYIQFLAIGRHFRLADGAKVIVGRNEQENDFLEQHHIRGVWLKAADHAGPTALILDDPSPEALRIAAEIVAGYSRGSMASEVRIESRANPCQVGVSELLTVTPMARDTMREMMV
jgi:predicted ribosome quality control (RQC) complex YloA/Tae2 family protein